MSLTIASTTSRRKGPASAGPNRRAVLEAARALIARGEPPSLDALAAATGLSTAQAGHWRADLVRAGELVLPPMPRPARRKTDYGPGLSGRTPAERAEIRARYAEELARKREQHSRAPSELYRPRLARQAVFAGPAESWEGGRE